MGISRGAAHLLAKTIIGKTFNRAATYGVQNVLVDEPDLNALLSKYKASLPTPSNEHISYRLLKSLGCITVESIDIYPNENPTHIIDLNIPVDDHYKNQFDLIYDGGTLEHCFDIAQVLRNTASMLSEGGRVIHHIPTNNWVDHGFYQVSPTLFFDFYEAAGFRDFSFHFHFMNKKSERYLSYSLNDSPPPYSIGKGYRVLSHFTAVKTESIDPEKINSLVQRRYREHFDGEQPLSNTHHRGLFSRLKRSFMKRTILLRSTKL